MDSPYSNREIDSHFQEIKDSLARIEEQTTKTNGRVTSLEAWKQYIIGCIAVLVLIGLPILTYNLYETIELSKQVYAHSK
jgi:hypothetical protein